MPTGTSRRDLAATVSAATRLATAGRDAKSLYGHHARGEFAVKFLMTAMLFAAPVVVSAQTAPAAAPSPVAPAAAKLSIDSSIETIAANPKGKAILDATFPGMLAHESYAMFKGMSLKQVQPYANGAITDAQVAKVAAELMKLG